MRRRGLMFSHKKYNHEDTPVVFDREVSQALREAKRVEEERRKQEALEEERRRIQAQKEAEAAAAAESAAAAEAASAEAAAKVDRRDSFAGLADLDQR